MYEMLKALQSVEARESEKPADDKPADYVDLPGGGRTAEQLLGKPEEKPKRSIWDREPEPLPPAQSYGTPKTNIAAPKPQIGWDLPQKSSGSREPEKKVSLGDVAKARKDYEREPFERKQRTQPTTPAAPKPEDDPEAKGA
jgi:hypothetical protein